MASYYLYSAHRTKRFSGDFSNFIRSEKFGLESCFQHYESWNDKYNHFMSYEHLLDNPVDDLYATLKYLGLDNMDKTQCQEIVAANTINKLRDKFKTAQTSEDYNFFRKGKSGDWVNHFNQSDKDYYAELYDKYNNKISSLKTLDYHPI
jgi:hypothetical protein